MTAGPLDVPPETDPPLPPLDELPVRGHLQIIDDLLDVTGRRVLDIGCGDGALVRALTERGATVVGVEVDDRALERARAHAPVDDESYAVGRGEDLPFEDGTVDVAIFFNSLHHVPVAEQPAALAEAARVLVPHGRLYVAEPIAAGSSFELVRPIDDETEIRTAALAALRRAYRDGPFTRLDERLYLTVIRYADVAQFREKMTAVDPARAARIDAESADIAARFEELGRREEDGWAFDQPMRVILLEKHAL
jgi:SAM-dependent methyltransferase